MSRRRPVRVSFLIDRLCRAGTETQLLALIRELDREKVEPSLVLLNGHDAESRRLEPKHCPVLRLGLKSFARPFAVAQAAKRLIGFWRQHQVSVVQTYFLDSTYFGVPLARICGITRVIRVRNNIGHWLTPGHRAAGRVIGRMAHQTLTNSHVGRAALWKHERGSRAKLVVVENGVDTVHFNAKRSPLASECTTVGCLANLRRVKGVDVLIAAAERLKARLPNLKFVVAGDGADRAQLQRQILAADLDSRFQLLGPVTDPSVFLSDLDIAVLPSRSEGMSNALLEYMAARRPIVATDVGSNRQVLDDGRCGLLVPPGDADAMANAIERLALDAEAARKLATAARNKAEAVYSRPAMLERFERFYLRSAA